MRRTWIAGVFVTGVLAVGCTDPNRCFGDAAKADTDDCGVEDASCTGDERPVVMVHGLLASGDTWANQAMRFATNGHCLARTYAFDWNTLGSGDPLAELDAFVDSVRQEAGAAQVDLVGHSAGGGLGYRYLEDAARAAKVAHYAHVGSVLKTAPAGPEGAPVPTLNVWSADDRVIGEKGDIAGATNVQLAGQDHYSVATSAESFAAIWKHFHDGAAPRTTALEAGGRLRISGKAVSLGENVPVAGGTVEVWETDPLNGDRVAPRGTFTIATDGAWGPFYARPNAPHEFRVRLDADATPVHYYREPFVRSNDLVYLRTLPTDSGIVGGILQSVEFDDAHTVVVAFGANRAFLAGRDTLAIGDFAVPMDAVAKPEQTTIALFAFDDGADGVGAGTTVDGFGGFGVFLYGLDLLIPAAKPASIPVRLNDRTLFIRNWPSASEGAVVAVFD